MVRSLRTQFTAVALDDSLSDVEKSVRVGVIGELILSLGVRRVEGMINCLAPLLQILLLRSDRRRGGRCLCVMLVEKVWHEHRLAESDLTRR